MDVAALFVWLQDAVFYRGFHEAAVKEMGSGAGRTWLDAGCGPGVLARLAAAEGYIASGIDRNPRMIAAAAALAQERHCAAAFSISDIETELSSGRRYDVVSASSLVVVTPDPARTLRQLAALTKTGGRLLIIEASCQMTRLRALKLFLSGRLGRRGYMILQWAMARSGRALPDDLFENLPWPAIRVPLLEGFVKAWIIKVCP